VDNIISFLASAMVGIFDHQDIKTYSFLIVAAAKMIGVD
jgi:hypothetical protein